MTSAPSGLPKGVLVRRARPANAGGWSSAFSLCNALSWAMVTAENRRNCLPPTGDDSVAASSVRLPMPIAPVPTETSAWVVAGLTGAIEGQCARHSRMRWHRRRAVDGATSSHGRRGGVIVRRSAGRAGPAWRRGYAMTTVVVFGGSGFLGRRLVRRLAGDGLTVRVAVRHPAPAGRILKAAGLDRVMVLRADVRDQATVAAAIAGADAVVNAVSAYVERGGETFETVHVRGAETVARGAAAAAVARLVLVSGIGADPESRSPYIRARGRGERAVQREFPGATIVRPSAMFGPGDALFGTLADLARLLPMLPLIGAGRTRLQPVYVEDVAEAVARMLADPATAGRTYETTGPDVYTLRELVGITLRLIGRRRLLVPVPFAIAEVLARLFEFLPSPPLTTGQVDLLRVDNVASGTLPGLQDLDIQPKAVEEVVPTYIRRPRASEPD